jgi:hypothetical protein
MSPERHRDQLRCAPNRDNRSDKDGDEEKEDWWVVGVVLDPALASRGLLCWIDRGEWSGPDTPTCPKNGH